MAVRMIAPQFHGMLLLTGRCLQNVGASLLLQSISFATSLLHRCRLIV